MDDDEQLSKGIWAAAVIILIVVALGLMYIMWMDV